MISGGWNASTSSRACVRPPWRSASSSAATSAAVRSCSETSAGGVPQDGGAHRMLSALQRLAQRDPRARRVERGERLDVPPVLRGPREQQLLDLDEFLGRGRLQDIEIVADAVVPALVVRDHAGAKPIDGGGGPGGRRRGRGLRRQGRRRGGPAGLGARSFALGLHAVELLVRGALARLARGANRVHVGLGLRRMGRLEHEEVPLRRGELAGIVGAVAIEERDLARGLAAARGDRLRELHVGAAGGGGKPVRELGNRVAGLELGLDELAQRGGKRRELARGVVGRGGGRLHGAVGSRRTV